MVDVFGRPLKKFSKNSYFRDSDAIELEKLFSKFGLLSEYRRGLVLH